MQRIMPLLLEVLELMGLAFASLLESELVTELELLGLMGSECKEALQ